MEAEASPLQLVFEALYLRLDSDFRKDCDDWIYWHRYIIDIYF